MVSRADSARCSLPQKISVLAAGLFLTFTAAPIVTAAPMMQAGSLALRHDIQLLADRGLIQGPVTSWPLAWGSILEDLGQVDLASQSKQVVDAVIRVRRRADWETQTDRWFFNGEAGLAENPERIRSFENTPRGSEFAAIGATRTGDRFSIDLNVQAVNSAQDEDTWRADRSMVAVRAGNWSFSASTYERFWGPGWDGSLILSNNARPIPSLSIDRIFTDPFKSKWLNWLGPWDLSVVFGQLEEERAVPNAQFFGLRFAFRPMPSLEIGLSRTALWCGDDRPCGFDTFLDLFRGRDNSGDDGVSADDEPGNQLAGLDLRWSLALPNHSLAVYGQFIGEDEAGGLPSRFIGQGGLEFSGYWSDRWSFRSYVEFAATSCQFNESSERFNCAYNHSIYQTGYRYRSRAIGHGADNDSRLVSAGLIMVDADDLQWRMLLRHGALNRGGTPDPANSLTPTEQELTSIDIGHTRAFLRGELDIGVGYEKTRDIVSGVDQDEGRIYVQWRSGY